MKEFGIIELELFKRNNQFTVKMEEKEILLKGKGEREREREIKIRGEEKRRM